MQSVRQNVYELQMAHEKMKQMCVYDIDLLDSS